MGVIAYYPASLSKDDRLMIEYVVRGFGYVLRHNLMSMNRSVDFGQFARQIEAVHDPAEPRIGRVLEFLRRLAGEVSAPADTFVGSDSMEAET